MLPIALRIFDVFKESLAQYKGQRVSSFSIAVAGHATTPEEIVDVD